MDHEVFALVEVLLVFGVVLAFCFYELYSLRRDNRRAREAQAAAAGKGPTGAPKP